MSTTQEKRTLEADLAGEERAIRHLIGEEKALKSRLARQEALRKLNETKLHRLKINVKPGDGSDVIPHGSRFIDVSGYQPQVDFPVVHGAKELKMGPLAVTKLTEGTDIIDPYGVGRIGAISRAGFPHVGAYCFAHPGDGGGNMARFFLEQWHRSGRPITKNDIVIYDCEVTDGLAAREVAAAAEGFGVTIRKECEAVLWLYGGGPFLSENGVKLDPFDGHWLAAYVNNPAPYEIFGAARTPGWQYTDGQWGPTPHSCPGVGSGDMSIIL